MITAMDKRGIIGAGNKLPWDIPEDLTYFMDVTMDHEIIMGRKTWDSLPKKPLRGRDNIIITQQSYLGIGYMPRTYKATINEILSWEKKYPETVRFVIGGAQIYKEFYPYCDKLYITYINDNYEGDVYFPISISQILDDFEMESRKLGEQCEFVVMRRKNNES
jgi:dihydrofolate reductase